MIAVYAVWYRVQYDTRELKGLFQTEAGALARLEKLKDCYYMMQISENKEGLPYYVNTKGETLRITVEPLL